MGNVEVGPESFQFGSQGFTRSEQECKNPGNGVGWLALAITSDESFDCNKSVLQTPQGFR